jgi:hypothetical protein
MDHRISDVVAASSGHPTAEGASPIHVKGFENFYIVGPVHSFEIHGDGTTIRKTHHQNGVTDVEMRRSDGTILTAIETAGPFALSKD